MLLRVAQLGAHELPAKLRALHDVRDDLPEQLELSLLRVLEVVGVVVVALRAVQEARQHRREAADEVSRAYGGELITSIHF